MDQQQYLKNLAVPEGVVDVVLDTDAFNEIDDQYAICYLLGHREKVNVKGICAAPFSNAKTPDPREGMEKSYHEIIKLLSLTGRSAMEKDVYRGSNIFLPDENTPVESEAADYMAQLAAAYTPENPLYIVAIGAISNVASALLKNPRMKDHCVIVWLGGNALEMPKGANEFNLRQDVAAARVVFGSGVPLVHVPCRGVVDRFLTTKPELDCYLKGKNALCDYLYRSTVEYVEEYAAGKPWSKPIWDVVAVAWLLNDNARFLREKIVSCPMPRYDWDYECSDDARPVKYVYWVDRDALFEDLFRILEESK